MATFKIEYLIHYLTMHLENGKIFEEYSLIEFILMN